MLLSLVAYFFLRKPFHTIFGRPELKRDLIAGFIIFIQLLLVSVILDAGARALGVNDTQTVDVVAQTLFAQGIVGVGKVIFSALAEEVFFRGILFSMLGSIPTVILFGLAHAGYGSLVEVIGALAAGVIFIRAREKYQSIFPGVVGHVLYNLIVIFVLIAR